jgi:hypothetical protein
MKEVVVTYDEADEPLYNGRHPHEYFGGLCSYILPNDGAETGVCYDGEGNCLGTVWDEDALWIIDGDPILEDEANHNTQTTEEHNAELEELTKFTNEIFGGEPVRTVSGQTKASTKELSEMFNIPDRSVQRIVKKHNLQKFVKDRIPLYDVEAFKTCSRNHKPKSAKTVLVNSVQISEEEFQILQDRFQILGETVQTLQSQVHALREQRENDKTMFKKALSMFSQRIIAMENNQ